MVILSSSLSSIHGPWLGRRDHQKQQSGNTTGKQRWFICITWPIWMAHISEKAKNYGLSFPRFSIYIYIHIYISFCDMDARGFMISRRSQTHTADRKKGVFVYICVKFTGIWEQPLSFVHFRPTSWQVICLQMGRTDIGFTLSLHLWAQKAGGQRQTMGTAGKQGDVATCQASLIPNTYPLVMSK